MLRPRVIPCLLLRRTGLVKTINFKNPTYVGDPVNTLRIFSEKEVDEIVLLDIIASKTGTEPNYDLIREVAEECFIPLTYGGGIKTIDQMKKLFEVGVEKIVLNTSALIEPELISLASEEFGSQSIVVSVDAKKKLFGGYDVINTAIGKSTGMSPAEWCQRVEELGAGEIFLTSIDQEGTFDGFDLTLIKQVADSVQIPVIAHGGANSIESLSESIHVARADATAAGSLFIYSGPNRSVLVNFPSLPEIKNQIWCKFS